MNLRPSSPILLFAGMAVTGAGFALIAFTWGRVAALESVALQMPYVVSGGLSGVGLVIVGALMVNVHTKGRDAVDRERQMQQLTDILLQANAASVGAAPPPEGDENLPGTDRVADAATEDLQWQA